MPRDLDAGPLEAEVGSFALRMAAEGKAPRTIRTYTEAVRWFAAYILPETDKRSWQEVDKADLRRWTVRLLSEYSTAYAGNQGPGVRRASAPPRRQAVSVCSRKISVSSSGSSPVVASDLVDLRQPVIRQCARVVGKRRGLAKRSHP